MVIVFDNIANAYSDMIDFKSITYVQRVTGALH